MKRRFITAAGCLLLAALAGGCAYHGDISKRSIVTVTAVARQEDGRRRVTVEHLTCLGSEEESYESRAGTGETFSQAVTSIEAATGRQLYLDGCRVLLLEGFRDRGQLEELLEEVDAHGGIRPLTLVAAGPAPDRLLEGEETGKSAGDAVFALLTGNELSRVNLKDCLNLLNTPGRGLLLPVVEKGEEGVQVGGYLSPGARGMLRAPAELGLLLPFARPGEGQGRRYTVTGEGYSADWVLEKNRLAIRPEIRDGEPVFTLEARVEGYLLSGRGELPRQELDRRAQQDICRQLLEEYRYLLENITRDSGNDIFSLGKHLEIKERQYWQNHGENWGERLPEIGLELTGSVLLRDKKRFSRQG